MSQIVKHKCFHTFKKTVRWLGWLLADQWFVVAMAFVIVISSQVQVPLDKQVLRQNIVTYGCVAIVFLITGLTLQTRVLLDNLYRWKVHIFIQLQCFLVTSAIMFGVVSAAASNQQFMDDGLLIGMLLLGTLPTTLSTNIVMTAQAHGNSALTVVQTTLGNTLGPFLTPLLFRMYLSKEAWYLQFLEGTSDGGFGEVYRRVFKQLGLSVYLPLAVGQVALNLFPSPIELIFVQYKMKKISSLAMLALIWQTFDQAFATRAFSSVASSNMIFVVFINIALFAVWLVIALATSLPWLGKQDAIAVAYCVPAKTPAMGVPLANVLYGGLTLLQESKLQIPMILFQGLQIASGSLLTIAFRRWIRPDEERAAQQQQQHQQQAAATDTGTGSLTDVDIDVERTICADNDDNGDGRLSKTGHDRLSPRFSLEKDGSLALAKDEVS